MENNSEGLHDISQGSAPQKQSKQIEVKLICESCGSYIEKNLLEIEGIDYVQCDIGTGLIDVRFNPLKTTADKIELAISESGYDTKNYKRKVEFYSDKPKCCEHREESEKNDNTRA